MPEIEVNVIEIQCLNSVINLDFGALLKTHVSLSIATFNIFYIVNRFISNCMHYERFYHL